jgi:hypothetical protein
LSSFFGEIGCGEHDSARVGFEPQAFSIS